MEYAVLDTDVASLAFKDDLPPAWVAENLAGRVTAVTFVTVGELLKWSEWRSWGLRRRSELSDWLGRQVILDSDHEVSQTWAYLSAQAMQRGRPRPANDTWVAACCLAEDMPLATFNVKDFEDFAEYDGLVLLGP
ncbi:MAG: type II toxin-antitoxin system VapC family toxin [Nocardioidaceae bacterium]